MEQLLAYDMKWQTGDISLEEWLKLWENPKEPEQPDEPSVTEGTIEPEAEDRP